MLTLLLAALCWADTLAPTVLPLYPHDNQYTNCLPWTEFKVLVRDSDGIDIPTTARLTVNDVISTPRSDVWDFADDTLRIFLDVTFPPRTIVACALTGITDGMGRPADSITWYFGVSDTPPWTGRSVPANDSTLSTSPESLVVEVFDGLAGARFRPLDPPFPPRPGSVIATDSLRVTFAGREYRVDGTILDLEGSNLILRLRSAGVWPLAPGGYTLRITGIWDDPEGCAPLHGADFVSGFAVTGHLATEIVLERGWNLVALPVVPTVPWTVDMLPPTCRTVYAWNNAGGEYVIPTTLQVGMAYWVLADSSREVPITGLVSAPGSLSLGRGWNMFALPPGAEGLSPHATGWDPALQRVYGYSADRGYFEDLLGNGLLPGRGYWTLCVDPATLRWGR